MKNLFEKLFPTLGILAIFCSNVWSFTTNPASPSTISVMTDTNNVLVAPTNLFVVNSNLVRDAIGFTSLNATVNSNSTRITVLETNTVGLSTWTSSSNQFATGITSASNRLNVIETNYMKISTYDTNTNGVPDSVDAVPVHDQDWSTITNEPSFLTNGQAGVTLNFTQARGPSPSETNDFATKEYVDLNAGGSNWIGSAGGRITVTNSPAGLGYIPIWETNNTVRWGLPTNINYTAIATNVPLYAVLSTDPNGAGGNATNMGLVQATTGKFSRLGGNIDLRTFTASNGYFVGDGSGLTALQGNITMFTNNAGFISTNSADSRYINTTGDVMTGRLNISNILYVYHGEIFSGSSGWPGYLYLWDEASGYYISILADSDKFHFESKELTEVADPTDADGVGDRGYNDTRYVNAAGDTVSGSFTNSGVWKFNAASEVYMWNSTGLQGSPSLYFLSHSGGPTETNRVYAENNILKITGAANVGGNFGAAGITGTSLAVSGTLTALGPGKIGTNTVTGSGSFAAGLTNVVSGTNSSALGRNNSVTAREAHARGYGNQVSGANSVADGNLNVVSGTTSYGGGQQSVVSNNNAFVWSDGAGGQVGSRGDNTFVVQATNGIYFTGPFIRLGTDTVLTANSAGDITAVVAGTLLSGGGTSGSVTMNVDTASMDGRYINATGTETIVGSLTASTNLIATQFQKPGNTYGNNTVTIFGTNNVAYGSNTVVAGGGSNTASNNYAVIAGGFNNTVAGNRGSIGGGSGNSVDGNFSHIGGGENNYIGDDHAVVSGGYGNRASQLYTAIPGGYSNIADEAYSFAAGTRAHASYAGTFVWNDYTGLTNPLSSTAENQWMIRSSGGVIFNLGGSHFELIRNGVTVFKTPTNTPAAGKVYTSSDGTNSYWATPSAAGGSGSVTTFVFGADATDWGREGNTGIINGTNAFGSRPYLVFDAANSETSGTRTFYVSPGWTNYNLRAQHYSLGAAWTGSIFFAYRQGGQGAFTTVTGPVWSGSGSITQWQANVFSSNFSVSGAIDCKWGLVGTNSSGARSGDTYFANMVFEVWK